MTSVRALPVPPGAEALRLLADLERALSAHGPILAPHPADSPAPTLPESVDAPAGGIAMGTSGSTGDPKRALLTSEALRASAAATAGRLRGDVAEPSFDNGTDGWLLALPAAHIAGLQVLMRSIHAGSMPVAMPEGPFTAAAFAQATDDLVATSAARRYVSLVPTQLARLLRTDSPESAEGLAALTAYDAVLVGGSAIDPVLLAKARDGGVAVVTTYGMSETAGGCVYDGRPLDGVQVRLEDGRIVLGGPMLASGYLADPGRTAAAFVADDGGWWFRTDDLGHLDHLGAPHLVIDGRIDDVIVTGGYKVHPAVVEAALAGVLPDGARAVVVGVPDPRWGQSVAAVVATDASTPMDLPGLRSSLARALPAYALPTRLLTVADLPFLGPGKPDRARIAQLLVRD